MIIFLLIWSGILTAGFVFLFLVMICNTDTQRKNIKTIDEHFEHIFERLNDGDQV